MPRAVPASAHQPEPVEFSRSSPPPPAVKVSSFHEGLNEGTVPPAGLSGERHPAVSLLPWRIEVERVDCGRYKGGPRVTDAARISALPVHGLLEGKEGQHLETTMRAILSTFFILGGSYAANFPFEEIPLTEDQIADSGLEALAFGDASSAGPLPDCKATPGSDAWPADEEWEKLGEFLGEGALLRPAPPAAVCYEDHELHDEEACRDIRLNAGSSRFFIDDPVTVLTSWPQGDSCPLNPRENQTCTQGGFPEYVVNVTEVWQIQAAVNFARNHDLRLVIKCVPTYLRYAWPL